MPGTRIGMISDAIEWLDPPCLPNSPGFRGITPFSSIARDVHREKKWRKGGRRTGMRTQRIITQESAGAVRVGREEEACVFVRCIVSYKQKCHFLICYVTFLLYSLHKS
jgi:hypothetical protein